METRGDFGRRADNVWTRSILPASGAWAARWRGEPVSDYPLTDDEQELRNRAYRYISPAHDRAWLDRKLAELRYTRNLPMAVDNDHATYFRAITAASFRSIASRYLRLRDDVDADRAQLGPFLAVAHRVRDNDEIRLRAMQAAGEISEKQRENALERNAENEQIVSWTCASIAARTAGYRYALEHLVVAGPQREAILAERSVIALERDPRGLCIETSPLIDPDPRNPNRGLDRPDYGGTFVPREIPVAPPYMPHSEARGTLQHPLVTKY